MDHSLDDEARRKISKVATIAALAISFFAAFVLIGVSIWGFWICRSFANPTDDSAMADESTWVAVRFCLSWLVLFAPFACVGLLLLRSTFKQAFGRQDESWIYPFRVFMAVVGMKVAAEDQAKGKRLPLDGEKLLDGKIEPEK